MSYQVLARKWRPKTFSELVGQEHVVTAISNALDNNRLHHAYLFTGTRGVGKTTIARIFSKSLNCETGMSSQPCGQCHTCQEIEQGNFVDLLEIDAASRTKVEDTRELLDNVQYKPTRGEYKVYLIDEVHMLSKHSFNALLKTLEEPPPHVKFLLATTDPQKLPITILSRCLQFSLKALSREQISAQLERVLSAEEIPFEAPAIAQLARAAQGSMRDALSLTDQAIAQGNGEVLSQTVTDMLGLLDRDVIVKLVHGVMSGNAQDVMALVEGLSQQAPDYERVIAEVMSLLHQVALTQFVPDACRLETTSARAVFQLAKALPPEQVQLLYQIALQGKKDIAFAPDGRTGLEMCLLRMLAFSPDTNQVELQDYRQLQNTAVNHPTVPTGTQDVGKQMPKISQEAPVAEIIESSAVDQELSRLQAEQDNILAAAQQLHADEFSSVDEVPQNDLNAPAPAVFEEQPVDTGDTSPALPSHGEVGGAANPVPSATETLLAIRAKLQQNAPVEEAPDSSGKKSASESPDDLTRILGTQRQTPQPTRQKDESSQSSPDSPLGGTPSVPEQDAAHVNVAATPLTDVPLETKDAPQDVAEFGMDQAEPNVDEAPPWVDDAMPPDSFSDLQADADAGATADIQRPAYDPNQTLNHDGAGEVDLDIPVFLQDGQKVIESTQLDTWSQLIEQMQVTALTKQLALHSAYSQQGEQVTLTLLASKEHLISDSAIAQLQQALRATLQQDIQLTVELGEPINTPFAIQQSINQVRVQHAHHIAQQDEAIQKLCQAFSATTLKDTIKPR